MEIFKTELGRRTQGALDVAFEALEPQGGVKDLIDELRADAIFAVPAPMPYFSRLDGAKRRLGTERVDKVIVAGAR